MTALLTCPESVDLSREVYVDQEMIENMIRNGNINTSLVLARASDQNWENISKCILSEANLIALGDFLIWDDVITANRLPEKILRQRFEMLDSGLVSMNQNLSVPFMEEFRDHLDWYYLSRYQVMTESFIEKYKTRVHWPSISEFQVLSCTFMRNFFQWLDKPRIAQYQKFDVDFIREKISHFQSDIILRYQFVPEDLYPYFDVNILAQYRQLSGDFIDSVGFHYNFLRYQSLTPEYIIENMTNIWRENYKLHIMDPLHPSLYDWILTHQDLSLNLIDALFENLNVNVLVKNYPNLPIDLIFNSPGLSWFGVLVYNVNWRSVLMRIDPVEIDQHNFGNYDDISSELYRALEDRNLIDFQVRLGRNIPQDILLDHVDEIDWTGVIAAGIIIISSNILEAIVDRVDLSSLEYLPEYIVENNRERLNWSDVVRFNSVISYQCIKNNSRYITNWANLTPKNEAYLFDFIRDNRENVDFLSLFSFKYIPSFILFKLESQLTRIGWENICRVYRSLPFKLLMKYANRIGLDNIRAYQKKSSHLRTIF